MSGGAAPGPQFPASLQALECQGAALPQPASFPFRGPSALPRLRCTAPVTAGTSGSLSAPPPARDAGAAEGTGARPGLRGPASPEALATLQGLFVLHMPV